MNIGTKPSKYLLILAIVLSVFSIYIPILSIFDVFISVFYIIISISSNKKFLAMAVTINIVILFFTLNISNLLYIGVVFIFPGILIGKMMKVSFDEKVDNKYAPIYWGSIFFVLALIVYVLLEKYLLHTDYITELLKSLGDVLKREVNDPQMKGFDFLKGLSIDQVLINFNNMISTLLFAKGLWWSILAYYFSVFFINRITKKRNYFPEFSEFHLPGQDVIIVVLLGILVILLDQMKVGLKTDILMPNMQMVFSLLFFVQGLSVFVYYFKYWRKNKNFKPILILVIILIIIGLKVIPIVGMFDSIFDTRKVRDSYKST